MKNSLTSGSIAAATGTTGLAQMMNWIPDDIGKLAVLVGIIASITVIIFNIAKTRLINSKNKKLQIEIDNMKANKDESN